jgi:hypothetical protein
MSASEGRAMVVRGKGGAFLRKARGDFFIGNLHARASSAFVDAIEGQLVLRDGIYAADPLHGYDVRGVYLWPIGQLLLVAHPEGAQQAATNVSALLAAIGAGASAEDVRKAFLAGEGAVSTRKGACSLKVAMRVTASPKINKIPAINQRDDGGRASMLVVDPTSIAMTG